MPKSGSAVAGLLKNSPRNFGCTVEFASPEVARQRGDEYVDTCALDMWSVGYIIVILLAGTVPWQGTAMRDRSQEWAELCRHHEEWVYCKSPFLANCPRCKDQCVASPELLYEANVLS